MPISKQAFSSFIKQFKFRELFNEMGWNNDRVKCPIVPDERTFILETVAEKGGFKILVCPPDKEGHIPDYKTRQVIEAKVTKLLQEHLIIYYDIPQNQQIWQLVVREAGKPTKRTETSFNLTQDPELLYQRTSGLFFTLDEEEKITIVDVKQRIEANFHQNAEKVTKQFYDKFKKEHTSFLSFIKGIAKKVDQEWYASLMLNRLMFCYFIQKKGFLDNNKNYLRDKLSICQERKGKNKFYSFYRDFLLVLFHKGLNQSEQAEEIKVEIGRIPFLNGGLFDEHELEKVYSSIDIDDKAFERVFDFFDQYEWHLDTRVNATGRDINPDVIGYIFEKYINDRAQMGAYYTKEDITEYISKNTVIPWLIDETKRNYPKAFLPAGEIWTCVKNSGDDYIYDGVKYGIPNVGGLFDDLPQEILAGFRPDLENQIVKVGASEHLCEIRKPWNQKVPSEIALPTETFRELIERRMRYYDITSKIQNGEISQINDFITFNLNSRQFVQDVIENTSDPEFLRHFYKSLCKVTILDPTCGSGAFLFAAMNILEPLYEACLMRMRAFIEEEDRLNDEEKRNFKNQYKYFREVLAETQNEHHPNLKYFIFKSIILRNLYGVDLMKEAVEIAKLRLFLKLVATVDVDYRKPNLGLEPLPDIDFNIRAGNTLVGFATEKDLEKCLIEDMMGALVKKEIDEKCDIIARTFFHYKEIQLTTGDNYDDFKAAKLDLNIRLKELNHELNLLLHKQASGIKYNDWLASHQPFHWFSEFYEIIHDKGGFDVIIGNPPYVVYTPSSFDYKVKDYETDSCRNLYAYCCERSFLLINRAGSFGMIIPNSAISADKLDPLQKIFRRAKTSWISNYAWRPAKLFEGANMLLAIVLSQWSNSDKIFTSKYHKWYNNYRCYLFDNIKYYNSTSIIRIGSIPKIGSDAVFSILSKQKNISKNCYLNSTFNPSPTVNKIYYFRAVLYWIKILERIPVLREDGKQTVTGEMKTIFTLSEMMKYELISILSSSIFFNHYITWSSCQVINSRDFEFPLNEKLMDESLVRSLVQFGKELQADFQKNSTINTRTYSSRGRSFIMEKQYFYIKQSKCIIDKIDQVLAEHFGFNQDELDFVINYDIKYRMGKDLEDEEEDLEETED